MRALALAGVLCLAVLASAPSAQAVTVPLCVGGAGYCHEVLCVSTDGMAACGDAYPCAWVADGALLVCVPGVPG